MRTYALFGTKKNWIFPNLWCVRMVKGVCTDGGGLSQCVHFADKAVGEHFSRFCADIFYGRPLVKTKNTC